MRQVHAIPHQHPKLVNIQVDRFPDACPRCHHAIEAIGPLAGAIDKSDFTSSDAVAEEIFRCPRAECSRLFIARYIKNSPSQDYVFESVTPLAPQEPVITAEVASVSPAFKEIYKQAKAAESYNLDQIAGVGYRKALEFLIKDYCIKKYPNAADAIKKEALGQTITNRVSDPNLKQTAERAAWLGNDETHYERRWIGQDIEDLKNLIQITMHWIAFSELTAKYIGAMPPGKP